MGNIVKYYRAEDFSPEQREALKLPESGTVALEVSTNSPVKREYIGLNKMANGNFFEFVKGKIRKNCDTPLSD